MDENDPIRSENDLRHWLASEDVYMSQHTRQWLERTAPPEAADILARIAQDANREARGSWTRMLSDFAGVLFLPSGTLANKGFNVRKAGLRAALMLADRNDPRCIAPLARAFQTASEKQTKYQKATEAALIRCLARAAASHGEAAEGTPPPCAAPDLRALAERIWNSGGIRRDLPRVFSDVLLLAIGLARRWGGEPDIALLQSIAGTDLKNPSRVPNRARVKEATRHALPAA